MKYNALNSFRIPALIILSIVIACYFFIAKHEMQKTINIYNAAFMNSIRTKVTPHLNIDILPETNYLWCGDFQLGWELFASNTFSCIKNINILRSQLFDNADMAYLTLDDIDKASFNAYFGLSINCPEQIKKKIAKSFMPHGQAFANRSIIGYSCFEKNLPFKYRFERFNNTLHFEKNKVDCFGVHNFSKYMTNEANQISIISYSSIDDFVISLEVVDTNDLIILAKIPGKGTLFDAVSHVSERCNKSERSTLRINDDVYIPVIDFDIVQTYLLDNSDIRLNYFAAQKIRFRLDEQGGYLKSENIYFSKQCLRRFVFNKPFMIMIKKKLSDKPYFVLWVGNSDLMNINKTAISKHNKGRFARGD